MGNNNGFKITHDFALYSLGAVCSPMDPLFRKKLKDVEVSKKLAEFLESADKSKKYNLA